MIKRDFCVQSFCEQRVKTRMGEVAAASDLRSERQQARLEAFWLEKGADEAQGWFQSDGGALGSTAIGEPEPEKSTCSPGEAEEGAELGDPPNVPVQVDIFLKLFLLIFNSSIIHLNIEYSTGRHVSVNGQI